MEKVVVALDWTPNINHIPFFVARELGLYEKYGLQVELLSPAADNYQVTPAKKVELGLADFALCPTESVISYRTKAQPFDLIGVATIFQHDLSAIAVRSDQGVRTPRDLDGKRYASYHARYEDAIIRQMIRNDGGKGEINIGYPEKLGIWETILSGTFDATWVFLNWEGVEAAARHAPLTYFKMADYQVPYSYSPLVAASAARVQTRRAVYRSFLAATREGVAHCRQRPAAAVTALQPFVPPTDAKIDLADALQRSLPAFGTPADWGKMDETVVADFLRWLYAHQLEEQHLGVPEVITNELL